MKLLFDQNLSAKLCARLAEVFPQAAHVRSLGLDTADDSAVWEYAKAHGFTLVTQDADFADLSVLRGPPPKVVWLRCGNQRTGYIESLLRTHAVQIQALDASQDLDCLEVL